tara:strand:+ start:1134 stop:1466 length:333 start_codon:yes stop_codon:yes gene_type:complete
VDPRNNRLNRVIKCLLFGLVVLALFDLVATILWVAAGKATEANPIMDYFLQKSFYLFAVVKLTLTFCGILLLDKFKNRSKKFIFKASLFLILIYAGLAGWHIIGAFLTAS